MIILKRKIFSPKWRDAGGKSSTRFPPGKLVKLAVDQDRYLREKYVRHNFIIFVRKNKKQMCTMNQQIINNNAWKLSGRSRKGPARVPGKFYIPLVKNISRPHFIIFARSMAKMMTTKSRQIMNNNSWKLSGSFRKGPATVPAQFYIPHVENIF